MEIDNQIFKFGIRDESISNSHKIECSVSLREDESLDPNETDEYGMLTLSKIQHILNNEIKLTFEKTLREKMREQSDEYLNLIGLSEIDICINIFDFIKKNNYDFIITNGSIAIFLLNKFQGEYTNPNTVLSSLSYLSGQIEGIDIIVDPHMKYTDLYMICGRKNKFSYNYEISDITEVGSTSNSVGNVFLKLAKQTLLYDIKLDSNQFISIAIIDDYLDISKVMFNRYKSLITIESRDTKIDKLFNE